MATPKEVVSKLYADFDAGNMSGVLDGLAPDVTWFSNDPYLDGKVFKGRAGVEEYLTKFVPLHDIAKFEVSQMVASGPDVVVFLDNEATWRPTGLTYNIKLVHKWVVGDAGASSMHEYVDTLAVAKAEKSI